MTCGKRPHLPVVFSDIFYNHIIVFIFVAKLNNTMKNFTLIFSFLLVSVGLMAGQPTPDNYVPYHARVNGTNNLHNLPQQQSTAGNSRVLQWKLLAQREDQYNDTTSSWNFIDSAKFGYNTQGTLDSTTSYYYGSGNWANSYAVYYTYNGPRITYGIEILWNPATNSYVNYEDVTQTFDGNNNLTQSYYRFWVGYLNNWRNYGQSLYTYDAHNNELTYITQYWDTASASWYNSQKTINTFDGNNAQLTSISQNWNAGSASWINNRQNLYTNDANGNHTVNITQNWYGGWFNNYKVLNTFDANKNITEQISQSWDSVNVVWVNSGKYDFTYDANNNQTLEVYYSWDAGTSSWIPYDQYQYTYVDGSKELSSLHQQWDNTNHVWVNSYKENYTYDGSFNETGYQNAYWNTTSNTWQGSSNYTYTYDANNNRIYELDQSYNSTNLTFENTYQYFFYYGQLDVTAINEAKNQLSVSLYPNPSTGNNVTLQVNMEEAANTRVGLYDAQGRLVTTAMHQFVAGANNIELNYNVAAGNYYLQVLEYATGKSSIIKFVKQ